MLGNLLDLPDFEYQSSEQVRDELKAAVERAPRLGYEGSPVATPATAAENLRDVPMYQVDPLLRRAGSLQLTRIGLAGAVEYRS